MPPDYSNVTPPEFNKSEESGLSLRSFNHEQLLAKIETKLGALGSSG